MIAAPTVFQDAVISDPDRDLLKIAVVERHSGSGNIGKGFVRGFGLKKGAIASSVAHDSHNIIVVGTTDEDMLAAVKAVVLMGGGLAVVSGGRPIAEAIPAHRRPDVPGTGSYHTGSTRSPADQRP